MSDGRTWVEALNIDSEKLTTWSAEVPEGMPLLFWCMERGHVSPETYLNWARENYQLPVLDSNFFTQALDRQDLPVDRTNGPWTVACFPVGRWDGLTYVACVEPPREVPTGQYVFVLANPHDMTAAWNEQPSQASASPSSPNSTFDMPEGMAMKTFKPFQLNIDDANLIVPATPSETAAPKPEVKAKPVLEAEPILDIQPKMSPPPAPPVAKPAAVAAPSGDIESQEIDLAFRQLKEHFISSMILKADGNFISLYKWSPEFDLASVSDKCKIDLSGPSLFRIVSKTKLPYHGYVVDSPVHRDFFKSIGFDDLPASVTAVPIKIEDGLWGMLVSIGTEAAQRAKTLQVAETTVEKLTASLSSVWKSAA